MSDFVQQFIDAMHAAACGPIDPGEIMPDDKKRRYKVAGDSGTKKSAVYQLRIEDGQFAFGWFLNFKQGETHSWSSKSDKKMSPEKRKALQKKFEIERKEREKKIAQDNAKAQAIAQKRWDNSEKGGTTEYLQRKQIKRYGARVHNGNLYVPMYDGQQIVNLQKIYPSGKKRFIGGGKKKGCFSALASKKDDKSTLVITEGFATGASIKEATGYPVIIAFDASNLKPVAQNIRKKYPDSRIIIAADNDQWTTNAKNEPWNPGIEKGKEAAAEVGGFIIWPDFNHDHPEKPTDFNDLHCIKGIDSVRIRLKDVGGDLSQPLSVSKSPQGEQDSSNIPPLPPLKEYEDNQALPEKNQTSSSPDDYDWKSDLIMNRYGKPRPNSLRNMILMLQYSPSFKGMFVYDEFAHQIIINRCPSWKQEKDFDVEEIDDVIITRLASDLERYGLAPNTSNVLKAVEAVAYDNRIHPARHFFNDLKWDGENRLEGWLSKYMGCEKENEKYLAFVGKKWMTAAVKRIFQPGCKFDHILVLEGIQGRGKSSALEALATFGSDREVSYFTDNVSIKDIGDKDTIMKVQGSIICELAELEGFSKKDDEEIKRWITMKHDDCRLPYARTVKRFPRQFVLAATTNSFEYLKDPTGNRRYWPCTVKQIDIDGIEKDRRQLWAEAVHYYKQGLYIGPEPEEMRLAKIEQKKRVYHDIWTDDVLQAISHRHSFKLTDIMEDIGLTKKERDSRSQRRIANILRHHGFNNRAEYNTDTGKTERKWKKEDEEVYDQEIEI